MLRTFEHRVALPLEELFRFHADPGNLSTLLTGWPGFRILRHASSVQVGSEVWLAQTFAGCVPVVMGFRHVLFDPPRCFAEELVHGPFARFHHAHEFEPAGPAGSGTLVRDTVEFRVKACFGGELGTRLFAEPFVRELFRFRHAALDRLARGELALRRGDVSERETRHDPEHNLPDHEVRP